MQLWCREFGTQYMVDRAITDFVKSGRLTDHSYHNDTCPSFRVPNGEPVLWVEHPLKAEREDPSSERYTVTYTEDGAVAYKGESLTRALEAMGICEKDCVDSLRRFANGLFICSGVGLVAIVIILAYIATHGGVQ